MKRIKIFFLTMLLIVVNAFILKAGWHPIGKIDCNEDDWVEKVENSKHKIIATSVHVPEGQYNYAPDNLLDGKKDTCWCPAGEGIHEFVILKIPKGIKGFRITNGLTVSQKLYKENNRVKRLYWALIAERNYESQGEEDNDICRIAKPGVKLKYCVAFQTAIRYDKIELKDIMEPQDIYFSNVEDFSWGEFKLAKTKNLYLIISIVEIYKGTKYNDTCISEIEIIP